MRRRIQERVNQCQAEIETLNRTKQELTEGRAKINENISQLDREKVCLFSILRSVYLTNIFCFTEWVTGKYNSTAGQTKGTREIVGIYRKAERY